MELLKMLASIIKDLPDMALWVIIIFFAYKVFIIGSIYGVLRMAISKGHILVSSYIESKRERELKHIELAQSFESKYSEALKEFHKEVMKFLKDKPISDEDRKSMTEMMLRGQAGVSDLSRQLATSYYSQRQKY